MTDILSFTYQGVPIINGNPCTLTKVCGNISVYDAGSYAIMVSEPLNGQIEISFNNATDTKPRFIEMGREGFYALDGYAKANKATVNLAAYNPYEKYTLILSPELVHLFKTRDAQVLSDLGFKPMPSVDVVFYPASRLNMGLDVTQGMSQYISPAFLRAKENNPNNPKNARLAAEKIVGLVLNTAELHKESHMAPESQNVSGYVPPEAGKAQAVRPN